ncbi:MAG: 1-(5-phosphoribosyl)-5-[(5-phosphoribosylamino)methylideneamino]imidazole-4-carboxamide isomerase [bacterium]
MLIIPAIDLKAGKCVRLKQGKMKKITVFSQEPTSIAKLWKLKGANLLHIVDLEGAMAGIPCNLNVVTKIIKSVDIPIQLGGGIRDLRTIKKVLSKGVFRVILGTSIFQNWDFLKKCVDIFKEKIVVSLDCFEGKIAISGWNKVTEKNTIELAKEIENIGVQTIIYTDIKSDGMLKGPNFEGIDNFAKNTKIPFIASGGISSLDNIKKIKEFKKTYSHLQGIIIGRAIYTGDIDLAIAIALEKEENNT